MKLYLSAGLFSLLLLLLLFNLRKSRVAFEHRAFVVVVVVVARLEKEWSC